MIHPGLGAPHHLWQWDQGIEGFTVHARPFSDAQHPQPMLGPSVE